MYKQRGNFVEVVKHKTITPSNDRASQGAMRQTVTGDPHSRICGSDPKIDQVEDSAVVAEVEEEVVPRAFLVVIRTNREQESRMNSI